MYSHFSTIQAAVDAIRRGEVVIVVDDEDRENEGDYICAAQLATAETSTLFMSGHGQLCARCLARSATGWICRRSFPTTRHRFKRPS